MRVLILILPLLALVACNPYIQTTSGSDYLAETGRSQHIDASISKVAAVEPDLRFPARIGVARVVNGQLTAVPTKEAALFTDFAARHAAYGSFVPVSPLVAALVAEDRTGKGRTADVVRGIRLGAARQHLDYVLIYEVGARSSARDTPFALADVTLIGGAFLPTRSVAATGVGQVLLVDVRNGYPYGTASKSVDISGLARSFGTHRRAADLRDRAILDVVEALVPEVEEMFAQLARAS